MNSSLAGKKLLVIGGAYQHKKIVETAQKMGVTVYVTDYLPLEKAAAKQIADKWYMYNITDIDEIVDLCKREHIDGVIQLYLDACQRPYREICRRLSLPCFGDDRQYHILTDKNAFKECCRKNGVDTIPEYPQELFESREKCERNVEFPILIKPADSRGSRGQSVCNTFDEAVKAIEFAESESNSGGIVIEKYMKGFADFSMSYIVINGEVYLTRTFDRYLGTDRDKMEKMCIVGVSPSRYAELYLEKVHSRVVKMIKNIGIVNGAVFMQGFVDGDTIRFYDPGLRFPGSEYDRVYNRVYDFNPIEKLIEFSLTGKIADEGGCVTRTIDRTAGLNGKYTAIMYVAVRPGTISSVEGMEKIMNDGATVSFSCRYGVGDTVPECYNVNQRFCEIDLLCDSIGEMSDKINEFYNTLKVFDRDGKNMVFAKFDTNLLP